MGRPQGEGRRQLNNPSEVVLKEDRKYGLGACHSIYTVPGCSVWVSYVQLVVQCMQELSMHNIGTKSQSIEKSRLLNFCHDQLIMTCVLHGAYMCIHPANTYLMHAQPQAT